MLFDYCMQFWAYWLGTNFNDPVTLQLLSAVSCIALVYAIIILPMIKIFRGRK